MYTPWSRDSPVYSSQGSRDSPVYSPQGSRYSPMLTISENWDSQMYLSAGSRSDTGIGKSTTVPHNMWFMFKKVPLPMVFQLTPRWIHRRELIANTNNSPNIRKMSNAVASLIYLDQENCLIYTKKQRRKISWHCLFKSNLHITFWTSYILWKKLAFLPHYCSNKMRQCFMRKQQTKY